MFGFSGSAQASLIGDTVSCAEIGAGGTFECDPLSAVVIDPGAEFVVGILPSPPGAGITVDIFDSSITYTGNFSGSLAFTIIELSDLDWVGTSGIIVGAGLVVSGITGLDIADVSFTDDSVTLDFIDTDWSDGDSATVTLETHHGVPEPGTLLIMGLGLAGLGWRRLLH